MCTNLTSGFYINFKTLSLTFFCIVLCLLILWMNLIIKVFDAFPIDFSIQYKTRVQVGNLFQNN